MGTVIRFPRRFNGEQGHGGPISKEPLEYRVARIEYALQRIIESPQFQDLGQLYKDVGLVYRWILTEESRRKKDQDVQS